MALYEYNGSVFIGPSGLPTGAGTSISEVTVTFPELKWYPLGDQPEGTYLYASLPPLPVGMTRWQIVVDEFEFTSTASGDHFFPMENVEVDINRKITMFCRGDDGTGALVIPRTDIVHQAKETTAPPPAGPYALTDAEWRLIPLAVDNYFADHPGKYGFEVRILSSSAAYGSGTPHVPRIQHMEWHDLASEPTVYRPPLKYIGLDPTTLAERWVIYSFQLTHTHHVRDPGQSLNPTAIKFALSVPAGESAGDDGGYTNYLASADRAAWSDLCGPWSETKKGPTTIPAEWVNGVPVANAPGQVTDWNALPGSAAGTFVPTVATEPSYGDATSLSYECDADLSGAFFAVTLGAENQLGSSYEGKLDVPIRIRAVGDNGKTGLASDSIAVDIPGTATTDPSGEPADTFSTTSLTFADGTASFSGSVTAFRYWDGTPGVLTGSGRTLTQWTPNTSNNRHGLMVDPDKFGDNNLLTGHDDRDMNQDNPTWTASLNVDPSTDGPIALDTQKSIVKASSWTTTNPSVYPSGEGRGWDTPIKRHDTIFVVDKVPPKGAFKPSAAGRVTSKTSELHTGMIDWAKIPNLTIPRRPSQDRAWLTPANCITTLLGQDLRYGNTVPFSWSGGHIDGRGIYGRENTYGASTWYPSYLQLALSAAYCYIVDSSVTRADKEKLVRGIVQLGYWQHKWIQSGGSTNVFHANVFRDVQSFAIAVLKSSTVRDQMITTLGQTRNSTRYITQADVDLLPPEGGDPRSRRFNARDWWPWDEPWMPEHIGFPWYQESKKSHANYGGRLWPHKNALYHQERFSPILVGQITSALDGMENAEVEQHDRIYRIWAAHYDKTVPISTTDSELNYRAPSGWWIEPWMQEFYAAHRDRIPVARWVGKPERPNSPHVTRSGTTVTVVCYKDKYDNGSAITTGRLRARSSTSRNYTTGGWTTVDTFTPTSRGSEQTRTFTWSGSFPLQVQLQYENAKGRGPWSGNWPWRADAGDGPGRIPSGNRGQVS